MFSTVSVPVFEMNASIFAAADFSLFDWFVEEVTPKIRYMYVSVFVRLFLFSQSPYFNVSSK